MARTSLFSAGFWLHFSMRMRVLQASPFSGAATFSVTCEGGDLGLSSPVSRSVAVACTQDILRLPLCVCRTQPFPQLINTSKRGICCCVELALSSTSAQRQCSCSGGNGLWNNEECSWWLEENCSIWKTEQRGCCSFQSPLTPPSADTWNPVLAGLHSTLHKERQLGQL